MKDHWIVSALLLISLSGPANAQGQADLTESSLESLLQVQVVTASKQAQSILNTPAAVFVITQDDIQRFGFTSIPEALRMAPGLDVARISGGIWAISARGFNLRYADKMLVLIDGRSVYSHTFAGAQWDVQDLPLEDVERIEVIRGPGGALWGANAVNGIINIITKSAKATKGGVLVAGTGTEEIGFSTFRWGGGLGQTGAYRLSTKVYDRSPLIDSITGKPGIDLSRSGSENFRADWDAGPNTFMVSGDIYRSRMASTEALVTPSSAPGATVNVTSNNSGANFLGRWSRDHSKTTGFSLQAYSQYADRLDPRGNQHAVTTDFDFQDRFAIGSANNVLWGGGYRAIQDHIEAGTKLAASPDQEHFHLYSVFAQDNLSLRWNLHLTVGDKVESNSDVGSNFSPNLKMLWTPSSHHSVWFSASHATSTGSRIVKDAEIQLAAIPSANGGPNAILTLFGNDNINGEGVKAYETGYRYQPTRRFFVDLATFYNVYTNLYTYEPGAPYFDTAATSPHLVLPISWGNGMRGETYGGEITTSLNLTNRWKVAGSYSFLQFQLHQASWSHANDPEAAEGQSPENQFQIRNSLDFAKGVQANAALYFVGQLRTMGIPAYSRVDFNLAWHFLEGASISAVAQNALGSRHQEFVDTTGSRSASITRSAFLRLQWQF